MRTEASLDVLPPDDQGTISTIRMAIRAIHAERRAMRPVMKFVLRCLAHPLPTIALLRAFRTLPPGFPPRATQVDALLKIGREHMRIGLTARQRADALALHYQVLARRLPPSLLAAYGSRTAICLAHLTGRDALYGFQIRLYQAPFGYRREGEATLSLVSCADGVRLADLTFTICAGRDGRPYSRIGGVQGPPQPDGKELIKAATKSLDGLRPKSLIIEALYSLGRALGAETILATSLSRHVLLRKKADLIRVNAYDAFWQAMGGILLDSGDYLLPPKPLHRTPADVPARERRAWERRQAHLASLTAQIRETLIPGEAPPRPEPISADHPRAAA